LRTALGEPLPTNAHAKIKRLLVRLELVLTQIAELERERDAVMEAETSDRASKMIQQLTALRGIGVQSEPCWCAKRSSVALPMARYSDHTPVWLPRRIVAVGSTASRAIGKAGNRRVRTVMVELAWLWMPATKPLKRAIRSLAPGRKNYLFTASGAGNERTPS
jgi:transposase